MSKKEGGILIIEDMIAFLNIMLICRSAQILPDIQGLSALKGMALTENLLG